MRSILLKIIFVAIVQIAVGYFLIHEGEKIIDKTSNLYLSELKNQNTKINEILSDSKNWTEIENKIENLNQLLKKKHKNEMDTLFALDKSANDILNTIKTSIQYNRNPQLAPILLKLQNSIPEEMKFYHSYIMQDSPAIPDTICKMRDEKDSTSLGYNYIRLKEFIDKAVKYRIPLIPLISNTEKEIVKFRNMEKGLLIYHYGLADTTKTKNQYIVELSNSTHKVVKDLETTVAYNKEKIKACQGKVIIEVKKTLNIALIIVAIGIIISIVFLSLPIGAIKSDKKKESKLQEVSSTNVKESVTDLSSKSLGVMEKEEKLSEEKTTTTKIEEPSLVKSIESLSGISESDALSDNNKDEMKEIEVELPIVPEEVIVEETHTDEGEYEEQVLSLDDEEEYKPK